MLLPDVEYARPSSVQEALRLLDENDGARPLAGGQTILNVMKARAAAPDVLVDLQDLGELKAIELDADGTVMLGAMATYTEVIDSAEARARPILGEVCAQIADVQVRNRGTVGGNICSNDPTNHLPPLLVALGATMTIAAADGERTVPAEEFFVGVYETAAGPGQLLTKISIPAGKEDGFAAVTIGKDGTCIVNVAASLDWCDPTGRRRTPSGRPCAARTCSRRPMFTRRPITGGILPRCLPPVRFDKRRGGGTEWRRLRCAARR